MSRTAALLALLLALIAVGCTPSLSPSEAKGVFAQGSQLLLAHPGGSVDKAHWPSAISALKPKSLYAAPEGLYICTSRFFVEERGFFVPHPSIPVVATSSTDPSFKPLAAGLFTYLIKS